MLPPTLESEIRATRAHCCRYRIALPSQASVVFCDDCHSLALPVSPTGCGRARPFRAEITVTIKLESFFAKQKRQAQDLSFCFGGEEKIRTSAPVIPTYTLSRGASSANLSTSPCLRIKMFLIKKMAERVRFELTVLSHHWFSRPAP